MIKDLTVKQIVRHKDQRGFFSEVVKLGEDVFHKIEQISYSEVHPGVIKAWHIHNYWEMWCIVKGKAACVFYDNRPESATKGETVVMFVQSNKPVVIAIPPNVAHGYKVVGKRTMGIIYHAEEAYDPSKKQIDTIPFDSPEIGFNWNIL